MASVMETHSNQDLKIISPRVLAPKRQDGLLTSPRELKSPQSHTLKEHSNHKSKDSNDSSVSFSTNHNSVVCLPLVSEGLKLVWTQSDQTRELDSIPELVQAFNVFPYPTSDEVCALARICALPLDKVKVWFMVQRIKYGISWASEDIEETRLKLARKGLSGSEKTESSVKRKNGFEEKDGSQSCNVEAVADSLQVPHKKQKTEIAEPAKVTSPALRFRSSLPPPQDSYYYRHPVETPQTPPAVAPPVHVETLVSSEPPRHGRYKKTKAQIAALRKSFARENWPDELELKRLQEETGLTRNDIRKWFSDSRYQLRNGKGLTSSPATHVEKNEANSSLSSQSQDIQPLSLTTKKLQTEQQVDHDSKEKVNGKGARKNRSKNSQFFQLFLSNTLEAFDDGTSGPDEQKCSEERVIDNNEEASSELAREIHSVSPPEPTVPLSMASEFISPAKKSSRPKSSKSARSVKASLMVSPIDNTSPSLVLTGRQRKTKEQLALLKEYFQRCPWPKSEEYAEVVELTSLPRPDVIQWFGDTRYAVKNGHVRWVRANVRDQVLAEIAVQQQSADVGASVGSDSTKKRKSQGSGVPKAQKSATDSVDIYPLELYFQQTGPLQEKDLDGLCRKSKMSYQQVRDWFASKGGDTLDTDVSNKGLN